MCTYIYIYIHILTISLSLCIYTYIYIYNIYIYIYIHTYKLPRAPGTGRTSRLRRRVCGRPGPESDPPPQGPRGRFGLSVYRSLSLSIYIYICIHVYMYVCIHVYMYICICVCISIYVYTQVSSSMYIHVSLSLYIYIYIYTSVKHFFFNCRVASLCGSPSSSGSTFVHSIVIQGVGLLYYIRLCHVIFSGCTDPVVHTSPLQAKALLRAEPVR